MKMKIGKGVQEGIGSVQSIGFPCELNLEKVPGSATLEEIAKKLAKICKIKNGEVELIEIRFTWRKDITPKGRKKNGKTSIQD